MNVQQKTFKILGIAFLFQFFTSFSSGVFLKSTWFVSEDIGNTMLKIAAKPSLIKLNIILDILTALGVIFLGAVLFLLLRKQNEKLALTAMGFYFLEATLLAVSRMSTFSLLRFSQEYDATGQASNLLFMGQISYDTMEFVGGKLHMLAFCLGAIIFYTLLHRSRVVPHWMSLWGLVTIFPLLVGTITQIFNYNIPFVFLFLMYLLNWSLVCGFCLKDCMVLRKISLKMESIPNNSFIFQNGKNQKAIFL